LELPNLKTKLEPRHGLGRGIYLLPSLFTAGTLVCGYVAMLSTLRGDFDDAAKAIGYAVLFDALDGRIARLTNSTSDFGREFDSLADVISFGVAPAFLAFAWGVRPIQDILGTQLVQHLRQAGWVVTFAFVICGAARLARFNIHSLRPATDRRHFVGLPIPGGAGVVAAVVHWAKYPVNDWAYGSAWLIVVALLAFLMVSRMRYPTFKTIDLRRRRSYMVIILIGITVYAIWAYSEYALLVIAVTYALYGPLARVVSKLRPRPPAQNVESSPGSEVHAT
jgi:CDP-diacylglycerol---serine O-phosphatidyltransferase